MKIGIMAAALAAVSLLVAGPVRAGAGDPAQVECGYDKGFYLQRKGGEQKLTIYGYMQVLWTGSVHAGRLETNEFRVRRGHLLAAGSVIRTLGFKLHVDFAASQPLLDLYMDYHPWTAFGIRAGQYKTPLTRQFLASAAEKQFVDDTIATASFKLDRDIGFMAYGAVAGGVFGYKVGVFNGAGKNALQDNTDFLYVARLEVAPLGPVPLSESDVRGALDPLLSIALATAYNTLDIQRDPEGETVTTARYNLGAELALFWRGLYAASEFFWRIEDPKRGVSLAGLGGYVQVGYMVLPEHLEVGVRGAMVREDIARSGDDSWEAGPVVNGFFQGHRLKLQLDYAALVDEVPLGADALDHRVRLQLQAMF